MHGWGSEGWLLGAVGARPLTRRHRRRCGRVGMPVSHAAPPWSVPPAVPSSAVNELVFAVLRREGIVAVAVPVADAPVPPEDIRAKPARSSKLPTRIWELEHKLLCPVVGTCLSMDEVGKLARKHGVIHPDVSDYETHVTVVSH